MNKARGVWLVAVAALAIGCGSDDDGEDGAGRRGRAGGPRGAAGSATAAVPVRAQPVVRGEIGRYIQTHARLAAERWVEVVSRAQGIVEELRAEEGDRVAQGTILLRLERNELRLRAEQAEVALAQARSSHERTKALFERALVSEEENEAAVNQLRNAETALAETRLSLAYTDLRAPIGGVVMRRDIELGDMVRVNQAVFAVADLDPLQALLQVPEKRLHEVRVGQQGRVTIDALPGRAFPAEVRMISPGVDPATGTVKVTLDVPSSGGELKPGMFATVRLITDLHPAALIIPKKALVLETDEDDVFVVAEGTARRVPVELGFTDGDRVEIRSGLSEDDLVITIGQEGLRDGAAVRRVGEAPAAGEGP